MQEDQPSDLVLPCSDKISFDNQKQASAAANVAQYQHGAKLRVYKCRYCKLWHLASRFD
jgi:hypothetical protein